MTAAQTVVLGLLAVVVVVVAMALLVVLLLLLMLLPVLARLLEHPVCPAGASVG